MQKIMDIVQIIGCNFGDILQFVFALYLLLSIIIWSTGRLGRLARRELKSKSKRKGGKDKAKDSNDEQSQESPMR